MLFERASGGKLPFTGETSSDTIASILKSELPLLSHFVSDVLLELEKIVGKCLRKSPDDRYQNVKDLQIDLKDLQQDLALQSKLERSQAPNKQRGQTADENRPTQILEIDKTNEAQKAVSTKNTIAASSRAEFVVSEFKRHKYGLIAVVSIFILSRSCLRYLVLRGA